MPDPDGQETSGSTALHDKKVALFAVVKICSKRKIFGGIGSEIPPFHRPIVYNASPSVHSTDKIIENMTRSHKDTNYALQLLLTRVHRIESDEKSG
jgi:hypothetical protein